MGNIPRMLSSFIYHVTSYRMRVFKLIQWGADCTIPKLRQTTMVLLNDKCFAILFVTSLMYLHQATSKYLLMRWTLKIVQTIVLRCCPSLETRFFLSSQVTMMGWATAKRSMTSKSITLAVVLNSREPTKTLPLWLFDVLLAEIACVRTRPSMPTRTSPSNKQMHWPVGLFVSCSVRTIPRLLHGPRMIATEFNWQR